MQILPDHVTNLRRIRRIREEAVGDDAEALARVFEDARIRDDGTLAGRIRAVLAATEHRWVPGVHTPLDVPGLYEVKGFGDDGFRPELRDPWPGSRDQVGHFLTALALALRPELVRARRFGVRARDWAGAPKGMSDEEVGLRLIIGHEKEPDPGRFDPLMLLKVRRQFASATGADVAAFRRALAVQGPGVGLDLATASEHLSAIAVGSGVGNSNQDMLLSLAGYRLAQLVTTRRLRTGAEVARWVRDRLAVPR
jgi:hypothetical protein